MRRRGGGALCAIGVSLCVDPEKAPLYGLIFGVIAGLRTRLGSGPLSYGGGAVSKHGI